MRVVVEVAVAGAADFTVAAACMPEASTAALEGFMVAAVAMQHVPHIQLQVVQSPVAPAVR
jgi:hypothetical protein